MVGEASFSSLLAAATLPGPHDHPEVEQVVIVEPFHRAPILQQS